MKIVIIGKSSFLGKSISTKWNNTYDLSLLSRNEYSFPERPFDDSFDWDKILEADAIIHCVAAGVQRGANYSTREMFQINCLEPIELVHRLETLKFEGQLITFGSYFSLGGNDGMATEDDFFTKGNPLGSDYSLSKYLFSSFLNKKQSGLCHTHLILSNLYGPLENPERLFPYINKSIANGDKLTFTKGDQTRQFTFVDDLKEALERVLSIKKGGIFHFTNPEILSVRQAITEAIGVFASFHNANPDYSFGDRKIEDASMSNLAINPDRFIKSFGSINFTSIKESLSSYLQ